MLSKEGVLGGVNKDKKLLSFPIISLRTGILGSCVMKVGFDELFNALIKLCQEYHNTGRSSSPSCCSFCCFPFKTPRKNFCSQAREAIEEETMGGNFTSTRCKLHTDRGMERLGIIKLVRNS